MFYWFSFDLCRLRRRWLRHRWSCFSPCEVSPSLLVCRTTTSRSRRRILIVLGVGQLATTPCRPSKTTIVRLVRVTRTFFVQILACAEHYW